MRCPYEGDREHDREFDPEEPDLGEKPKPSRVRVGVPEIEKPSIVGRHPVRWIPQPALAIPATERAFQDPVYRPLIEHAFQTRHFQTSVPPPLRVGAVQPAVRSGDVPLTIADAIERQQGFVYKEAELDPRPRSVEARTTEEGPGRFASRGGAGGSETGFEFTASGSGESLASSTGDSSIFQALIGATATAVMMEAFRRAIKYSRPEGPRQRFRYQGPGAQNPKALPAGRPATNYRPGVGYFFRDAFRLPVLRRKGPLQVDPRIN